MIDFKCELIANFCEQIVLIRFDSIYCVDSSASSSGSRSLFSPPPRQQQTVSLSPYLNYDPRFLQQAQPEFIFPEGASKQRGRFELAFSQIGSTAMVGDNLCSD